MICKEILEKRRIAKRKEIVCVAGGFVGVLWRTIPETVRNERRSREIERRDWLLQSALLNVFAEMPMEISCREIKTFPIAKKWQLIFAFMTELY